MTQRYALDNIEVYELWWWYRQEVLRATSPLVPKGFWFYSSFDNGTKIPKAVRELYRTRSDLQKAFPRPFQAGVGSYHEWLLSNSEFLSEREIGGFEPV
jgi:hypothetical protein